MIDACGRFDRPRAGMRWPVVMPLVLLVISLSGCAAAADHCPASVLVSSRLQSSHDGWTALRQPTADVAHYLAGVGFSRGHPKQEYLLKPQRHRADPDTGATTSLYDFAETVGQIWLICYYTDTRQLLARPISATRCEVTQSTSPGDFAVACD